MHFYWPTGTVVKSLSDHMNLILEQHSVALGILKMLWNQIYTTDNVIQSVFKNLVVPSSNYLCTAVKSAHWNKRM